jgi:hypothetical protein
MNASIAAKFRMLERSNKRIDGIEVDQALDVHIFKHFNEEKI